MKKKVGKKRQMKQNKGREKQVLQNGTKNEKQKEKTKKNTSVKNRKHWKQEKEEARNEMRRLAATDDPWPMSMSSLRPQNQQLWAKREVNQEEKNSVFSETTTRFFQHKLQKGKWKCFFLKQSRIQEEIWIAESTNKDVFDHKGRDCVPITPKKRECSLWKADNWKETILRKRRIFQNRCDKKRRKVCSGQETTLIWVFTPMSKFTHNTFLIEHAIWFFTELSEGFVLFFLVRKSQCITTGTLTTPSVYCVLQTINILNTLNSGNLSFQHTRQCIESVARRLFFFCTWAGTCANWTTRLLTLRSCLVRSFHFASFRVRFLIRALPSIPHIIISFPPTPHLLSVNQFPFQNIARVHPRRPSGLANSSFEYRWTDSSPRPCAK